MSSDSNTEISTEGKEQIETCGIVMPISSIDGCTETHWADVLEILNDSITEAGFQPNLVSNADEIGVIQKRIIQNLYTNPIVICDVSGKNPNVMFELGVRLAFDKPTIIIKDDKTTYSFDTAPIEHLQYPKDLRFNKMVEFKALLTDKIRSTYHTSKNDANYSTFLKHFGEFKVPKLEEKEVSGQEFILDELKTIRNLISSSITKPTNYARIVKRPPHIEIIILDPNNLNREEAEKLIRKLFPEARLD